LLDVRKEIECIVMMKKDADEQDERFEIELGERWSPCTLFVAFGKGFGKESGLIRRQA
jgi:hypothetical protein